MNIANFITHLNKNRNSDFIVEELSPHQYEKTIDVITKWQEVAEKWEEERKKRGDQIRLFFDSFAALGAISLSLSKNTSNKIYICKHRDMPGILQSIVTVDHNTKFDSIDGLATRPWNLQDDTVPPSKHKVRGASRALLRYLEQQAIQNNKAYIRASPLDSSYGFYKKAGYDVTIFEAIKTLRPPGIKNWLWATLTRCRRLLHRT